MNDQAADEGLALELVEPDNFIPRAERRRIKSQIEPVAEGADKPLEPLLEVPAEAADLATDASVDEEIALDLSEDNLADDDPVEFDNEGGLDLETTDVDQDLSLQEETDVNSPPIDVAEPENSDEPETTAEPVVKEMVTNVPELVSVEPSGTSRSGSLPKIEVSEPIEEVKEIPSLNSIQPPVEAVKPKSVAKPIAERTAAIRPQLDFTGHPAPSQVQPSTAATRMQRTMQACMKYYYARPEIANGRSNWGLMHSVMVYGVDTKVIVGKNKYSAIAWVAGNNVSRGQRILTSKGGRLTARSGVGLQGHQGQLLAVLSLTGVPQDYPLYAEGKKFAVSDLVHSEAAACKSGEELTFTLIGLSHYMSTDAKWQSSDGQQWDFERLIREELSQPVVGAACGGTHRLMGFAHALRMRRAEGLPITGQWARAQKFMDDFEAYAYRLQNRDGSMSTKWFEGRQDNGKMDRKIQTTGHIVEWLLTITPDDKLDDPRLVRSVQYLVNSMYKYRNKDWSIGPKGHALRSIALYHERVFGTSAWGARDSAGQRVTRLTTKSLR